MKVEIEIEAHPTDSSYGHFVTIKIDGKYIASGPLGGGEPEDNSIYRDYAWVVPAMQSIAEAAGASVEVLNVECER